MTVLSGQTLRTLALISPFHERTEAFGMTFGVGPAGYDVRMEFDSEGKVESVEMGARGFRLVSTIEHFQMPRHIIGLVCDKSSWARQGLTVQNTVIEPGWSGYLTVELTNHRYHPLTLIRGMPIAQIVFQYLDQPATMPYEGKYNDQGRGPQGPR